MSNRKSNYKQKRAQYRRRVGKPILRQQDCCDCQLASLTINKKEAYCKKTKRFGSPYRGSYCKNFKMKIRINKKG